MNHKYQYKTQEGDPELLVKLPRNLLQDFQKMAKENGHTLNTEIIIRLVRSLETESTETLEGDMFNLLFK